LMMLFHLLVSTVLEKNLLLIANLRLAGQESRSLGHSSQ